jgi:hypothetical protein
MIIIQHLYIFRQLTKNSHFHSVLNNFIKNYQFKNIFKLKYLLIKILIINNQLS